MFGLTFKSSKQNKLQIIHLSTINSKYYYHVTITVNIERRGNTISQKNWRSITEFHDREKLYHSARGFLVKESVKVLRFYCIKQLISS